VSLNVLLEFKVDLQKFGLTKHAQAFRRDALDLLVEVRILPRTKTWVHKGHEAWSVPVARGTQGFAL
jgi:hypothetical protein